MTHHQDRALRRERSNGWTGGAVLLVIAAALFAEELGISVHGSLWGLLLFIPAISIGIAAWHRSQEEGASAGMMMQAAIAAAFVLFAVAIIAGMDLGMIWPALLVLLGVSAIVRSQTRAE